MQSLLKHWRFKLRWWRWLFGGPSSAKLVLSGVDKQARDVIYQRWLDAEPKEESN